LSVLSVMSLKPVEHIYHDREALAEALARAVAANLEEALAARATAVLALSGGTTPTLFMRRLATQRVEWSKVVVTLCDERWVPPTNERSNARLVRENLLQGPAAAARFEPLYADAADPESALERIARRIVRRRRVQADQKIGERDSLIVAQFVLIRSLTAQPRNDAPRPRIIFRRRADA